MKKKLIIAAVLIPLVFLVLFFLVNKRGRKEALSPTGTASWMGLTPNVSTKEEVVKKLGNPQAEKEDLLTFPSKSAARAHEVVFSENKAVFFKEIVSPADKKTVEDLRGLYGVAPFILYGPDSPNGDYLFVYPEKGVAYLANPETGSLLEIWYFPANTLDGFISAWASGYSKERPSRF